MKLAFCSTMTPFAEKFKNTVEGIDFIQIPSAAQVMNMLRNEDVDLSLIGREAYSRELTDDIKKKRLQGGVTLTNTKKAFIHENQLKKMFIKTYLSKELVKKVLPNLQNVKFYPNLEKCEMNDIGIPMLIDWQDFKDNYELLIPINEDGSKIPIFRAPVLFYNKSIENDLIKKFSFEEKL